VTVQVKEVENSDKLNTAG